jgi:hypothetical protein
MEVRDVLETVFEIIVDPGNFPSLRCLHPCGKGWQASVAS